MFPASRLHPARCFLVCNPSTSRAMLLFAWFLQCRKVIQYQSIQHVFCPIICLAGPCRHVNLRNLQQRDACNPQIFQHVVEPGICLLAMLFTYWYLSGHVRAMIRQPKMTWAACLQVLQKMVAEHQERRKLVTDEVLDQFMKPRLMPNLFPRSPDLKLNPVDPRS